MIKYAVKREDGTFNGVYYDNINDAIKEHHTQYGQSVVPVSSLTNTSSEEEPVWVGVEIIPPRVGKRQGIHALILTGKYSLIQPAIDSIVDPVNRELIDAWFKTSDYFERSNVTLIYILKEKLGMTDIEIDELFVLADTL